jgi:hypothetical protein
VRPLDTPLTLSGLRIESRDKSTLIEVAARAPEILETFL